MLLNPKRSLLLTILLLIVLFQFGNAQGIDTVYAGKMLPNAALIKSGHARFMMLVSAKHVYSSIKYLDEEIRVEGDKLIDVQKLINGTYVNTDSVIVNHNTLVPLESYSDINTSKDSFIYNQGKVTGTLLLKDGPKKGTTTHIDTTFAKPLFNGLIYAETFQGMSYVKNKPFILAEYVPGHQTKFTRVEYVKNETLYFAGKPFDAKVIKATFNSRDIYYWLDAKSQELLKIEAKFPGFDYYLLSTL